MASKPRLRDAWTLFCEDSDTGPHSRMIVDFIKKIGILKSMWYREIHPFQRIGSRVQKRVAVHLLTPVLSCLHSLHSLVLALNLI